MQTTAHPPLLLPHYRAAREAEMSADQRRRGNLSSRTSSECCATPQELALTSPDLKSPTFLTHTHGRAHTRVDVGAGRYRAGVPDRRVGDVTACGRVRGSGAVVAGDQPAVLGGFHACGADS